MELSSNVFVISVLILGLITSPLSFAQTSENDSENITIELEESISIISENAEPEDTEIDNDTTNLGQQVSDFVRESRELFEQQKEETKEVIVQCRENMRNAEPSERESVIKQCRTNLDEIRESYKSLRETYHETFKEFRENIKIFIQESKGLPIDSAQRDAAIANIKSLSDSPEKRELLRELEQKMDEQIREDKQKLRDQEKREREIAREKQKDEQEALRKALKAEQENTREALKAEQEILREQEKKQREMERELKQKEREAERDALQAQDETLDDKSSEEEIETELEIEVEVEKGIAKIKVESNDEKFEFEMGWTDEQSTIAEIASRTGLTASQIEEVIKFEIELEDESDENEEELEKENLEDSN